MVTVLKKGSYFGEIGLLRACRRTTSIRAVSETVDLFVLSKVTLANSGLLALLELHVHTIRQKAALRRGRVSFKIERASAHASCQGPHRVPCGLAKCLLA